MGVPGFEFRVPSRAAGNRPPGGARNQRLATAWAAAAGCLLSGCFIWCPTVTAKDDGGEGELRRGILATCFWVGEPGNEKSAWDPQWVKNFGGVDDPARRNSCFPADFVPKQNPFYCALPYNDVAGRPGARSALKDRWVEVRTAAGNCFCQLEDVGPWHTDDREYVLGRARPKAEAEGKAGIDLSPAVRDYLKLSGRDLVDWCWVAPERVPAGPWRQVVTGPSAGTSGRGS